MACMSAHLLHGADQAQKSSNTATQERIAALIRQLDDDGFEKRQDASKELVAIGKPALAAIRTALRDNGTNAEVSNRLHNILDDLHRTLLSITIKSNKTECLLTDIVKITCTIKNDGDEPITVLLSLDGSLTGNRQPHYSFQVSRVENGRAVEVGRVPPPNEKSYLSAFKAEDFVKIEPGKEVTIDPHFMRWWYPMHEVPGKYKIRLDYSLKRTFEVIGEIKPHTAAVDKLMADAWEGETSSNEIEVTVKQEQK